ncbi:MAG: tRNA lysidine(34) synthetase TilS [Planctomycetes bacterium]|nr:tRNA lysidine(34) synthetase TilS [Planctomycetota bacterium]
MPEGKAMSAEVARHPVVAQVASGLAAVTPSTSRGVVAVSGGRDSMALMAAMSVIFAGEREGACVVAHVHHHQRSEADEECELVRHTASNLGLAFEVRHLDLPCGASPASLRAARYAALIDVAMSTDSSWIATAHQAQDQLETVLLAIVRGAGPTGLVGMDSKRELTDGIMLVRPMLEVDRSEAASLCKRASIVWCDDPGNVDPNTLRGRLRQEVLPVLESMRPGVARRLSATRDIRSAAVDALAAAIPEPNDGEWPRDLLSPLPSGLLRATIHAAAVGLAGGADVIGSEPVRAAAEAVKDSRMHRRIFELGGGVVLVLEAQRARIDRVQPPEGIDARPPM